MRAFCEDNNCVPCFFALFFFLSDVDWFSKLLLAISSVLVERFKFCLEPYFFHMGNILSERKGHTSAITKFSAVCLLKLLIIRAKCSSPLSRDQSQPITARLWSVGFYEVVCTFMSTFHVYYTPSVLSASLKSGSTRNNIYIYIYIVIAI